MAGEINRLTRAPKLVDYTLEKYNKLAIILPALRAESAFDDRQDGGPSDAPV